MTLYSLVAARLSFKETYFIQPHVDQFDSVSV